MKLAKQNIYRARTGEKDEDNKELASQIRRLNDDLTKVFLALQGRLEFGTGTDGENGENIAGQFQEFTVSAGADTEFNIAHTIGSIPKGFLVMYQNKAGQLYQDPTVGTDWTATQVSLKSTVDDVLYNIFLIK